MLLTFALQLQASHLSCPKHLWLGTLLKSCTCLNLNAAKCEVVKMTGRSGLCGKKINLAGHSVETQEHLSEHQETGYIRQQDKQPSGLTLQCDVSAKLSVKARTTYFICSGEGGCIPGVIKPAFWFEYLYDLCHPCVVLWL